MSTVGQTEKKPQQRVVKLFYAQLGYDPATGPIARTPETSKAICCGLSCATKSSDTMNCSSCGQCTRWKRSLEGAVHDSTSGALDGYDKEDVAGLLKDRLVKARERLEETRESVKALREPVEPR